MKIQAFLLLSLLGAASGQECLLPAALVETTTVWRRPEPIQTTTQPRYGPGVIPTVGSRNPHPERSGTTPDTTTTEEVPTTATVLTEPYVCPDTGTTMIATKDSDGTSGEDFLKIVNLGTDGNHVEVEILQGFTTGTLSSLGVEVPDGSGLTTCGFTGTDVESGLVSGGLLHVPCFGGSAQITMYGSTDSTVASGCSNGSTTTVESFTLLCSCDEPVEALGDTTPDTVPDAVDDAFETPFDTPITDTVLTNDSSPDGVLTPVTLVSDVSDGTLVLETDGSFTYTPNPGTTGTDSFVYQASSRTLHLPYPLVPRRSTFLIVLRVSNITLPPSVNDFSNRLRIAPAMLTLLR